MAMGYLIIYEYEGKKGNDFSKVEPFQWILDYREKFPGIVLENWQESDVPLMNIEAMCDKISIDKDLAVPEPEEVVEIEPDIEPVPEEPEKVTLDAKKDDGLSANEYIEKVTSEEELKQKRLNNLAKARKAKKKKAENGNADK